MTVRTVAKVSSSTRSSLRESGCYDGTGQRPSASVVKVDLGEMKYTVAFLLMVPWISVASCQGFDYASACTRPYRSSRAKTLPTAPCDLTKHSYCTTPGSSYPWHAIRRFVRENQGLMRRMYGEERHIAVLKPELENYIDDDDDEDYDMRKAAEYAEDMLKTKLLYTKKSQGRAMNTKPHFRPIQTTPASVDKNKKSDNETLKVKPLILRNNTKVTNKSSNASIPSNETVNDDKGISYKTKLESIANIEINNLDPDVITLEAVIKQSIETNSIYPNYAPSPKSELSIDEKNSTAVKTSLTTTEAATNSTETTTKDNETPPIEATKEVWKPISDMSTLPPTLLFSEHEKINKNEKIDINISDKKEEFHQKVHHQDLQRPSVVKLHGANACETKEELTAPFWANSTRGEVLALLNMYPFEQYIHLETCVHERKQMYCREGCRCEQQYRLHRLLAYDPRNECRGIFADWFKFPACCICRCYDVPLEFRARSPRILPPQYGEDVKRAIYEDVARDWYNIAADEVDEF